MKALLKKAILYLKRGFVPFQLHTTVNSLILKHFFKGNIFGFMFQLLTPPKIIKIEKLLNFLKLMEIFDIAKIVEIDKFLK